MPRLFAALALDGAPSLHVCFHFAELLADALEPAHLPAGNVASDHLRRDRNGSYGIYRSGSGC
jgi:hypothetical protein